MGAHAAGELASKMATESIPHTYRKLPDRAAPDALREAMRAANQTIFERGQANAEFQGMGTTASALVLLPRVAIVGHVGDSRVYRYRRGRIEQLTFDHSLVWEMTAAGQMPRGDVASFIPKNIITRSLGPHGEVQVDLEGPFPLEVGDTFMLCSDGLSGQLKDDEIGAVLATLSPQEAVRVLVDMANLRGGPDNITAIVVRVEAIGPEETDASTISAPAAPNAPSAHPAWWVLVAGGVLAALVLAAMQYYLAALIAALVGGVAAIAALAQNLMPAAHASGSALEGPLGTGPHASQDNLPNAQTVTATAQMARQLREASRGEHWTLDWHRFDSLAAEAQSALASGNYSLAVRNYALSISHIMNEIRRQSARKDQRDNSVLDL
jgi:protein phosphatase